MSIHFAFEYPWIFLLLLLVPCFWRCPAGVVKLHFPKLSYVSGSFLSFGREPLLYAAVFSLFVTALASPIAYDRLAASERHGRDLVLALDTSGSMAESGFSEEDRMKRKFDAVLEIVDAFLTARHDDNVGLVMFGSFAYPAAPVTYDLVALREILRMTDVGIAGESTAIGEGIAQALRSLRFGHAKRKVIVLVTDGYQNAGSVSIADAVERAKKMGVTIYTIGVGKPGQYDGKLLEKIANETGGRAFFARGSGDLAEVFATIATLEPSPIRSRMPVNRRMLFVWPLMGGMILLIGYLSFRGVR